MLCPKGFNFLGTFLIFRMNVLTAIISPDRSVSCEILFEVRNQYFKPATCLMPLSIANTASSILFFKSSLSHKASR